MTLSNKKIAWEPRVVIASPTVYPRFVVNDDFSFFSKKVPGLNRFPKSKFEANRSRVQTNKQTDRQIKKITTFIYIYNQYCFIQHMMNLSMEVIQEKIDTCCCTFNFSRCINFEVMCSKYDR